MCTARLTHSPEHQHIRTELIRTELIQAEVAANNKAGEVAASNKAGGVTAGRKAVEVVAGHQAEDVVVGQYKKRDRTNELTRSQYDIDLTKTGHIYIDNLISP